MKNLTILRLCSRRANTARNARGGVAALAIASAFILVPLALLAFEISSVRMQFNQLQTACDQAAIAGATWLTEPTNTDVSTCQNVALTYFQKGFVLKTPLKTATLSSGAGSSCPKAGVSEFYLDADPNSGNVSGTAVIGYSPGFFPGLGPYPLRVYAKAGPSNAKVEGDVIVALDLSGSTSNGSDPVDNIKYKRHKKLTSGKIVYSKASGNAGIEPFISPYTDQNYQVPDPTTIRFLPSSPVPGYAPVTMQEKIQITDEGGATLPFSSAPGLEISPTNTPLMYKALDWYAQQYGAKIGANPPTLPINPETLVPYTINEVMLALLIESKRGDLETPLKFVESQANKTVLANIPTAALPPNDLNVANANSHSPFQMEYNKLALQNAQPHWAMVEGIHYMLDYVKTHVQNPDDVHWGLVGFGNKSAGYGGNSGEKEKKDYSDVENYVKKYTIPLVELDQQANKADEMLTAIDESTLSMGTNTGDAIAQATKLLTDPTKHRPGKPKSVIIITDGAPEGGGSTYRAAQAAGRAGINVYIIGFFEGGYARPQGPITCAKIAAKAGGNSKFLPSPGGIGSADTQFPLNAETMEADQRLLAKVIRSIFRGTGSVSLR